VWAVGVADDDPDRGAGAGLAAEHSEQFGVFGDEESAVDEDADLSVGGLEQAAPDLAGDRAAVRVGGVDLGVDRR
jgi:hypothetical protein